jgi:dynein heavy chain
MNKCFDIYTILEEFNWRFTTDEMNRRWQVFGGPKEITQAIDERIKKLEKDSKSFLDKMKEE